MARKRYSDMTHPRVWWECKEGEQAREYSVHGLLFTHVQVLEQEQYDVHLQNLLNAQLYGNRDLMAFDWQAGTSAAFRPLNANLENLIQSVCETLRSNIAKDKPKATPTPRGADFDVYLKARLLDKWLYGEFMAQDLWAKGQDIFLDGTVFGTGVLKVYVDDGEIFTERVNPDEIIVDQRECVSCDMPLQIHQRKLVSRLWLLETFPDYAEEIEKVQSTNFQYTSYRSPSEEQVVVIESWRLPIRGEGGRHVLCIENATLVDEPYTRDKFPFVFFRFNKHLSGFYGRSLVEDLTGYQIRLNELNEAIRIGQDVMCVPRVFFDPGGGIVKTHFDNTIGRVIQVRGPAPQAQTWNAFNPEIYNERDRIVKSAFEFAGVSQLSAQAKLPTQARLDSSDALREYNAIENERFNYQAQAYEKFYLEVAHHLVELAADLYKNKEVDRTVKFRASNLVMQIPWSEVDLDVDKYVLTVEASSILNMSPAARKDMLNQWASAGVISREQYQAWSGYPDLEHIAGLLSAANDHIEFMIDRMLHGEPQTPDPLDNLDAGFGVVHKTYLKLRTLDTPEDILMLFRNWIELAKEMMEPAVSTNEMSMGAMEQVATGAGLPPSQPGMEAIPPEMMMDPSMGGMPPMEPTGMNEITGAPAPAVSSPAANAFLT